MLTPSELKFLYSEDELRSDQVIFKAARKTLVAEGQITSVATRDLTVSYGVPPTLPGVDSALKNIAKALQMIDPVTHGTDLIRVRRLFSL